MSFDALQGLNQMLSTEFYRANDVLTLQGSLTC